MRKSKALALVVAAFLAGVAHAQGVVVEGRWTLSADREGAPDAPAELVISIDKERVAGMLGEAQIRGTFREGTLTFTTYQGLSYDAFEGIMQTNGTLAGKLSHATYSESDKGYWLKDVGTWVAIRKTARREDAYAADDGAVLTAVVDHTIRAYVQKHAGRAASIFVVNYTAPVCDRVPGSASLADRMGLRDVRVPPYCTVPTGLEITNSDFESVMKEIVALATHRDEFVASINERNTVRHLLPVLEGRDITRVAAPHMMDTPAGRVPATHVVFSLPGYSSGGYALVSGFVVCGENCGGQFEWMLEKQGATWHVRVRDGHFDFGPIFEPEKRVTKFDLPAAK